MEQTIIKNHGVLLQELHHRDFSLHFSLGNVDLPGGTQATAELLSTNFMQSQMLKALQPGWHSSSAMPPRYLSINKPSSLR